MLVFKYNRIFYLLIFVGNLVYAQEFDVFQKYYQKSLDFGSDNRDSAVCYYDKLVNEFNPPSPLQQAKIHYLSLKIYPKKQDKDSLPIVLEEKLKSLKGTDVQERADLLFKIGKAYTKTEQSHKSIPFFLDALKLYTDSNMQYKINHCKINLSESYRAQDQIANAMALLREVLNDKNLTDRDLAYAYNRMAALFNRHKYSIDSVIKYSEKCIAIATKNNYYRLLGLSQNELGYIFHKKQHNFNKAVEYYKDAINNFSLVSDDANIINTRINYSNLLLFDKRYQKALIEINKSLKTLNINYPSRTTRRLFLQLSKIHRVLKNYKEALEYLDLANLIERMIYYNKVDRKIFEMATKYDVERKEQQLHNQHKKNKLLTRINHLLWFGSFLILIVFSVSIHNFRIRRKLSIQKQLLAEKEKKDLQAEVELKNRELLTKTLQIINQNELENNIILELKDISKNSSQYNSKKLLHICKEIKLNHNQLFWDEFEKSFTEVNKSFFINLIDQFPDLSRTDIKLCAFIKLNMSTKDMAAILNISPRGVETARYRLRKKIHLEKNASLYQLLKRF